jgi:hypothetical protein
MFGHWKKMVQFYSSPKFGVGMSVWSWAIGVHTKINITMVKGCKGHVK